MRYYLITIQHNAEKDAENRSIPKAFDDRLEAVAACHAQIATDIKNASLDWSINMLINSAMGVEMEGKFERAYVPEPESQE